MSDEPSVTPWRDVRLRRGELVSPPRPISEYAGFRDYFDDVIAPTLGQQSPEVQLGYPHLKRRG